MIFIRHDECSISDGQFIGHNFIDILKVDIESSEFSTLTSMIKPYVARNETLPFGQLQIELHLWGKSFEEFYGWWDLLEQAGLRPFWTEVSRPRSSYFGAFT